MKKITPFLWYDTQAEEAMNQYVSIFKNSKVLSVNRAGDKVMTVNLNWMASNSSGLTPDRNSNLRKRSLSL
jgi:predicted 3-demethylubiquinone-9 3-methyltransferase (glyoxalase superfamily)